MYMNLEITKKIHRNGVVMNPTIHPARKRNVLFDMPHITIMQMFQNRESEIK